MVIDIGSSKKKRVNEATPKKLLIFLLNFICVLLKGLLKKFKSFHFYILNWNFIKILPIEFYCSY